MATTDSKRDKGKKIEVSLFRLNTTTYPKEIDAFEDGHYVNSRPKVRMEVGVEKESKPTQGIYKIENGKLWIATQRDPGPRPTDFTAEKKQKGTITVFVHTKTDEPLPEIKPNPPTAPITPTKKK